MVNLAQFVLVACMLISGAAFAEGGSNPYTDIPNQAANPEGNWECKSSAELDNPTKLNIYRNDENKLVARVTYLSPKARNGRRTIVENCAVHVSKNHVNIDNCVAQEALPAGSMRSQFNLTMDGNDTMSYTMRNWKLVFVRVASPN